MTLLRLGGHFAGGTVLHWAAGLDGRGVLLSGDIVQVVADRRWVSFMYSYPNLVPLPGPTVTRMAEALEPFPFERIYGAWYGRVVEDGKSRGAPLRRPVRRRARARRRPRAGRLTRPAAASPAARWQAPAMMRPSAGWGGARRGQMLVILGSLAALGPLSMDAYLPALPSLSEDLDASAAAVQLTVTACLLGLATGQLVAGPFSDRLGRRRPLLVGLAGYAVVSALCALAPSVWALVVLRLLQGLCGAAGIVIARAVVRDHHDGTGAARVFGLIMVVTGAAPILAPIGGAAVLHFGSWRGIFVALAAAGAAICVASLVGLPESLPPSRRRSDGLRRTLSVFRGLLRDRWFVGHGLATGLVFGAMFAYIAGSPFVLQEIYGLSPAGFSLVFGLNALGIVTASVLGSRVVGRVPPGALLRAGLVESCAGAATLLLAVVLDLGVVVVCIALFAVVTAVGLVMPNATALALADHPETAGSASALLGLMQFVVGAAAAPLVGLAGAEDALPMAITIAVLAGTALVQFELLTRDRSERVSRRAEEA